MATTVHMGWGLTCDGIAEALAACLIAKCRAVLRAGCASATLSPHVTTALIELIKARWPVAKSSDRTLVALGGMQLRGVSASAHRAIDRARRPTGGAATIVHERGITAQGRWRRWWRHRSAERVLFNVRAAGVVAMRHGTACAVEARCARSRAAVRYLWDATVAATKRLQHAQLAAKSQILSVFANAHRACKAAFRSRFATLILQLQMTIEGLTALAGAKCVDSC